MGPKAHRKPPTADVASRRQVKRDARAKLLAQAANRRKDRHKLKWEATLTKWQSKRWRDYRLVGERMGRKRVTMKESTSPYVQNGNDRQLVRREIDDEPATVYAVLDGSGNVMTKVKIDGRKGQPNFMTSKVSVQFDYGFSLTGQRERLAAKQQLAKLFELAENATVELHRLTKIECELLIEFDTCRAKATEFLQATEVMRSPPGMTVTWPWSKQIDGKHYFRELAREYSSTYFTSCEAVSIAAKCLYDSMHRLPDWFRHDATYWDLMLWRIHEHVYRRAGSIARRVKRETKNLPLKGDASNWCTDQEEMNTLRDLHSLDKNVIRDLLRLKALSYASPIANAALTATRHSDASTARKVPMLRKPKSHFMRQPSFFKWIEHFYTNQDMEPQFPLSIGPYTHITTRLYVNAVQNTVRRAIRTAAKELAPYAHNELVAMVWRDFILPEANGGSADNVNDCVYKLQVALAGGTPDDLDKDDANVIADPLSEDEEISDVPPEESSDEE